jgi:hypothetical protein
MFGSPEGCWLILKEDAPSGTCWGPDNDIIRVKPTSLFACLSRHPSQPQNLVSPQTETAEEHSGKPKQTEMMCERNREINKITQVCSLRTATVASR